MRPCPDCAQNHFVRCHRYNTIPAQRDSKSDGDSSERESESEPVLIAQQRVRRRQTTRARHALLSIRQPSKECWGLRVILHEARYSYEVEPHIVEGLSWD